MINCSSDQQLTKENNSNKYLSLSTDIIKHSNKICLIRSKTDYSARRVSATGELINVKKFLIKSDKNINNSKKNKKNRLLTKKKLEEKEVGNIFLKINTGFIRPLL